MSKNKLQILEDWSLMICRQLEEFKLSRKIPIWWILNSRCVCIVISFNGYRNKIILTRKNNKILCYDFDFIAETHNWFIVWLFCQTRTLEELKKHLSGHVRLRLSISTNDLGGKTVCCLLIIIHIFMLQLICKQFQSVSTFCTSHLLITAAHTAYAGTEGCYILRLFFFFFFI